MNIITSERFGVLGVKIFSKTEFVEKEGNVLFNDTLKKNILNSIPISGKKKKINLQLF